MEPTDPAAKAAAQRSSWPWIAACVLAAAVLTSGVAVLVGGVPAVPRVFNAASSSMAPLLRPGDYFVVAAGHYGWREPQRGDVVVYRHPMTPDVDFIKRIVALGGDRIAVAQGRAIVNGVPVSEPYIDAGDPASPTNTMPERTVPSGSVFVLGDNRPNSVDSRHATVHGPVPVANLIGRATYIVWSGDPGRIGEWIGTPKAR